jgi:hypothetical protein
MTTNEAIVFTDDDIAQMQEHLKFNGNPPPKPKKTEKDRKEERAIAAAEMDRKERPSPLSAPLVTSMVSDFEVNAVLKFLGDAPTPAVSSPSPRTPSASTPRRTPTSDEIIAREDVRAEAHDMTLLQMTARLLQMATELHALVVKGGR